MSKEPLDKIGLPKAWKTLTVYYTTNNNTLFLHSSVLFIHADTTGISLIYILP